jgi:hypothetical protein
VPLFNTRINEIVYALVIEDWNYLESDQLYVDVPFEKKIVSKLINENLISDNRISLSFQTPIISAPYIPNSIGGISLSSISSDSGFSKELVKAIQLMVPPEYRSLPPPEVAYNGSKFKNKGFEFHLAERPFADKNILSGTFSTKYLSLNNELIKRNRFPGEFSIFSNLSSGAGTTIEIWTDLLKNFAATEVTLPMELDELMTADVDITRLKRVINEDLWLQIVYSHQLRPGINSKSKDDLIKINELLKKDLHILLSDIQKEEISREYIVASLIQPMSYNLKRIAQSFARAEEKSRLTANLIKKARTLIVDNFTEFIEHPKIHNMKSILVRRKDNVRYDIVQWHLKNNSRSSAEEVYEGVKASGKFRDFNDLKNFLNWLRTKDHVIVGPDKKYIWV